MVSNKLPNTKTGRVQFRDYPKMGLHRGGGGSSVRSSGLFFSNSHGEDFGRSGSFTLLAPEETRLIFDLIDKSMGVSWTESNNWSRAATASYSESEGRRFRLGWWWRNGDRKKSLYFCENGDIGSIPGRNKGMWWLDGSCKWWGWWWWIGLLLSSDGESLIGWESSSTTIEEDWFESSSDLLLLDRFPKSNLLSS